MSRAKPAASLSIDLDNQWSYMKTHGNPDWVSLPSYLNVVVPRFMDFLDKAGLKVTVFVVGQDAVVAANVPALRSIVECGHEVGNHSFHHEPWLHLYTEQQVESEIARAEQAIESATGVRPTGFRGPGYSLSAAVLATLARRGYLYDASTLPTYIGPLARAYYFMSARLTPQQRAERKLLFGTLRDGLRPIRPYCWRIGEQRLLEMPVTTMPGLRLPFHFSYILYLALYSKAAALAYMRTSILACRVAGVQPSLLLHPLDLLGGDEAPPLAFFPAMRMPVEQKLSILRSAVAMVTDHYEVLPLGEHAKRVHASQDATRLEFRWQTS